MLIKYFTPYAATLLLMKTHATTTPTLSPQHTTQNGSWNRNWWKLAKFQMKAKYNLPIPFVIWIWIFLFSSSYFLYNYCRKSKILWH